MWGLIAAVVAIVIAVDAETKLSKLEKRVWEDEQALRTLRERLDRLEAPG